MSSFILDGENRYKIENYRIAKNLIHLFYERDFIIGRYSVPNIVIDATIINKDGKFNEARRINNTKKYLYIYCDTEQIINHKYHKSDVECNDIRCVLNKKIFDFNKMNRQRNR